MKEQHELTLLSFDDVIGKEKLEIFNQIGTSIPVTDLCILTGAKYHKNKDNITAPYYTSKMYSINGKPFVISDNGKRDLNFYDNGNAVIIPVFKTNYNINAIKKITCGSYPQNVADIKTSEKLEYLYQHDLLKTNNESYTLNVIPSGNNFPLYKLKEHKVYVYNNEKYIRVKANFLDQNKEHILSNGKKYQFSQPAWVKDEALEFYVYKNLCICNKGIVSGILYNKDINIRKFNDTNINLFMNEHMSKEIFKEKIKKHK